MRKIFGLCMAILLLCAVVFPVKTFAADDPNSEGIIAFREALVADSDALDRIFRQDVLFASPFIQAELEIFGTVENDAFKSAGTLEFWIYADDGSVTDKAIDYYMVQNGKDMTIYFKNGKQWEKFNAPTLAAAAMDLIATPNESEIEKIIDDTKDVTILEDNPYRRILLVRLDGDRLADSVKAMSEENPADNVTANDGPMQDIFMGYLDTALRKADIWYMWTIDKRDWHTVAMQYNFSGILQELARAALNDPNQTWSDQTSNLLETIAYYSEVRAYTTYPADPKAKKLFEIPKNVLKAKTVNDIDIKK